MEKISDLMKNPAAAATTAGEESGNYEKLSGDIVSPNPENVKPLTESAETLTESGDKSDVKTYEDSSAMPADERTEGTTAKDVPFSVYVACVTRITDLTNQLHDCEKMAESIKREISELEAFIK